MTKAEIKAMLLPASMKHTKTQKTALVGDAPEAFDWLKTKPKCLQVRDQGNCGSCWAFSAVGPFSDNRCISGKDFRRVQYSEQYMVSCDAKNFGCDGGYLKKDMAFLQKTGVPTDKCIIYESGSDGDSRKCPTKCVNGSDIVLTKASKYEDVCAGRKVEESIKVAITQGTLQTAFTVYSDFMYYESGIYQHVSGSVEGGHAVTIVGYGEENSEKYWNIRNSWGASWGESGYFRIRRGNNECGIEEQCFLVSP